jgi:hypothetical protein
MKSKKNVPNNVRRTMANLERIRRIENKQREFFNACLDKFNKATKFLHETNEMMNTKCLQSIFGSQYEILDRLVVDIQSCTEWKSINVGSEDLPTLNSNSAKKNRQKLYKWLLVQRPIKSLKCYLAYEDQIKVEIAQIQQSIQTSVAYIVTMCDHLNKVPVSCCDPNGFNLCDINMTIDLNMKKFNDNDNCDIDMLEDFNNIYMNFQRMVDAWKNFTNEPITVNELIEWRKDRERNIEADKMKNAY